MTDRLTILQQELEGSIRFFLSATNLNPASAGYGLTLDCTKRPGRASIAATGFALSAWVIACERGLLPLEQVQAITRGTLRTLLENAANSHGFFAHFLDMESACRLEQCEYSTIDTALCLNGVITAAAYFHDHQIEDLAQQLLARVDWHFIVKRKDTQAQFYMAYNPDFFGDLYAGNPPGFIYQWEMAAEQKMMYLQAAPMLEPDLALQLYRGFRRDTGAFSGRDIIINPGGTLFAYLFSEAWLDTARYLDPDGIDWFENTRLAVLANRQFCLEQASQYKTYHSQSWGLSAGDSPWGYEVAGSLPCALGPYHSGTVSIYSAIASLPFAPDETLDLVDYLYHQQPKTWGEFGFFDAYNCAVKPEWYSQALYGIDKGCSLLMIENYLSGLIWDVYTQSPLIQNALGILGFKEHQRSIYYGRI
jgi:hypothetical protein